MIEIVRDQVVYNAGSNLEVACIYKNTTGSASKGHWNNNNKHKTSKDGKGGSGGGETASRMSEMDVIRILEASKKHDDAEVPKNTILWMHNDKRFSHRNRRRCVRIRIY